MKIIDNSASSSIWALFRISTGALLSSFQCLVFSNSTNEFHFLIHLLKGWRKVSLLCCALLKGKYYPGLPTEILSVLFGIIINSLQKRLFLIYNTLYFILSNRKCKCSFLIKSVVHNISIEFLCQLSLFF